jgi:hypothetical protein
VSQAVEHLPRKYKALPGSNPSIAKKKKKRKENKWIPEKKKKRAKKMMAD